MYTEGEFNCLRENKEIHNLLRNGKRGKEEIKPKLIS